jgi:hypothetical protein
VQHNRNDVAGSIILKRSKEDASSKKSKTKANAERLVDANETMDYVLKISREDASSKQRETIDDDKWMPTRFIVGRLEQSKGADFMVERVPIVTKPPSSQTTYLLHFGGKLPASREICGGKGQACPL